MYKDKTKFAVTKIYCILFFLVSIFFPLTVNACSGPDYGSQYDKLIRTLASYKSHKVRIKLPSNLPNSKTAKVYIAYAKAAPSKYYLAAYMSELKMKKSGENLTGQFKFKEKKGYKPYIHVIWRGKPCDVIGNKFF